MKKKCRLCNKQAELINSHIIPEFMYIPVYGEEGAIATGGKYLKNQDAKTFKVKKGMREHLLCAKCDNEIIGVIEGIAFPEIERIRNIEMIHDIEYLPMDYKYFKLFQISILWRASISTNFMFKNVSLGKKHEEKIRKMLLSGDPGKFYEYGCMTRIMQNKNLRRSMLHTLKGKFGGHTNYIVITPGIHFSFFVSSHSNSLKEKSYFLQENNVLPIIKSLEYETLIHKRLVETVLNIEDQKS